MQIVQFLYLRPYFIEVTKGHTQYILAQNAPESILEHLNFKNFPGEHAPRAP